MHVPGVRVPKVRQINVRTIAPEAGVRTWVIEEEVDVVEEVAPPARAKKKGLKKQKRKPRKDKAKKRPGRIV